MVEVRECKLNLYYYYMAGHAAQDGSWVDMHRPWVLYTPAAGRYSRASTMEPKSR